MPDLFIITGSNGSGKSSFGKKFLPKRAQEKLDVFDGDLLYMQKQRELYREKKIPLKEASRQATDWMYLEFKNRAQIAIRGQQHFAYEGHFPDEDKWKLPKKFKRAGYKINVIFLGLSNTDISALRVLHRAKAGGHNVPPYEIERNFYGNLIQLNKHYRIIDELQIIDTSDTIPKVLAIFNKGIPVSSVPVRDVPEWFEEHLPTLYHKIFKSKNPLISEGD